MAGKLSEIRVSSPAAAITGTELVEVTQSGATKATTVAEILGAQSLDGLSDVAVTGAAQGAILYRAAAGWVHLPAGAAGQVLTTAGAGANPAWAAVAGGSGGTVTSVALSLPAELTVSGSPVTSSGTLSAAWANQTAGKVLAAPASSTGAPSFRALESTDLPSHSHQSSVAAVTASTGTTSLDAAAASASGTIRVALTQSTVINIAGAVDGQRLTIELTQDATGGRTVTLGSMFAFGADLTSFTASTSGSKTDILGVQYHAASSKYRVLAASKGF